MSNQRSLNFDQPSVTSKPSPSKPRSTLDPDQAAKRAIARRAKPSAVPDHVRLTLTLDIPRALAERLSARAIREEKNLEGVVAEILKAAKE